MIRVKRRHAVIVGTVILGLLVCMLFYPLANDFVVFQLGGRLILNRGAVPYRDFLDMKQPLTYYLFAGGTWLLGPSDWSMRVVDIVYHLVALTYFYVLLRRVWKDERVALWAVMGYTVYYVGTAGQMMSESFALLPQLLLVDLMLRLRSLGRPWALRLGTIAGLLVFSTTMLKVTLLSVAALPVLFVLLAEDKRAGWRYIAAAIGSFTVALAVYVWWLDRVGALGPTMEVLQWLRGYSNILPIFSIEAFRDYYYKGLGSQFLLTFEPTFVLLLLIALVRRPVWSVSRLASDDRAQFRLLAFVVILIGTITIAVERKGFNYHFTRFAWALMPFVAEQLVEFQSAVAKMWRSHLERGSGYSILVSGAIIIVVVGMLLYSPVPRVIDQAFGWPVVSIGSSIKDRYQKLHEPEAYEAIVLAERNNARLGPNDEFFLWGNCAQAYRAFDRLPPTFCIVVPEFVSPWTPQSWIDSLSAQLQRVRPKLFLCQRHDSKPNITGTSEDSYSSLRRIAPLRSFVDAHYDPIDSTNHFVLYQWSR